MNKKGAFQTQNLIIGGVLLSAIVFIFAFGFTSFSANYPDNPTLVNDEIAANYDSLTSQIGNIEIIQNESLSEEGLGFRGNFDVTFGSFFTVITLMFNSIQIVGDMGSNLVGDFDFIDPTLMGLLMIIALSILSTMLVLKLINAVGRNPI